MTSSGLFVVVDPVAARPPRGATLVASANPVTDSDPHWTAGLTWSPETCGTSSVVEAVGVCGGAFSGFTVATRPEAVQYVPPHVAVGQRCSGISGVAELQATQERARRLLDRCQTLGIARELWRGDKAVAETPDLPNAYFGKSSALAQPNGTTSTAAWDALGWLEDYLASCSCGGVGMIHATPYTATIWSGLNLLERLPDGRIVTKLGTIVVADPGYDGSAPTQGAVDATKATAWAYATSMVDLRLGPVTLTPSDVAGSALNRTNNDWTVYAHRPFAATFDPCCLAGVKVNHASRT